MQFSITAIALAFATMASAMPTEGLQNQEHGGVRYPVPKGLTVKEAQAKCGDQAQLSCCNKAVYAGDTTDVNSGLAGGLLGNLIAGGSGSDGLGIFDQCSKLDVQIPILIAVPIQDLVNQKCKQNIACCANSPASAVSFDLIASSFPDANSIAELRPCRRRSSLRCPRLHPLSASLHGSGYYRVDRWWTPGLYLHLLFLFICLRLNYSSMHPEGTFPLLNT